MKEKIEDKEYMNALKDVVSNPKFDNNKFYKCLLNDRQKLAHDEFLKEKKFLEWKIKALETEKQRLIEEIKDFKGVIHDMDIKYNKALLEVVKIKIEYIEKHGVII